MSIEYLVLIQFILLCIILLLKFIVYLFHNYKINKIINVFKKRMNTKDDQDKFKECIEIIRKNAAIIDKEHKINKEE